jgi:hypothetical protein
LYLKATCRYVSNLSLIIRNGTIKLIHGYFGVNPLLICIIFQLRPTEPVNFASADISPLEEEVKCQPVEKTEAGASV